MNAQNRAGTWSIALSLGLLVAVSSLQAAEEPSVPPQEPKAPPRIHAPRDTPKDLEPKSQSSPPKAQKSDPSEPANNKGVLSLPLKVKLALMGDPRLLHFPIEVEANGAQVVLSGKVPGESETLAAANVALGVPGVTSVLNKLEVVKETRQAATRKQDEVITALVKERFERSTTLKTAGFGVKTEDGVVVLSGKTRFQVIVLEAAEAASQVPGVKAVRSDDVRIEGTD